MQFSGAEPFFGYAPGATKPTIMKNSWLFLGLLGLFSWGCQPFQEADMTLPALTIQPAFSAVMLDTDSNTFIVTDLTTGGFDRNWSFPGGIPATSKKAVDTIFYQKAGTFDMTLWVSQEGGAGVATTMQQIVVATNAVADCDPFISLLTGECGESGKCWTLTHDAQAIRVGPTPGSVEWYVSPENGLQADQYDDMFCFEFEGQHFQYNNNGLTIDPWNGYAAVPFDAPTDLTWFISAGTGDGGKDQIVLPEGAFIGTWDASNVYDIVSITENVLVLRTEFLNGAGWFEFTLVKV
jgi:PKD repeat protein